jgi:hypothetical protein
MPLAHQMRAIKNVMRNVFARETLPDAPERSAPPAAPRVTLGALLFAREALALDAEPPATATRRGAFTAEPLAEDPPEPPRPPRRGLLGALFAPEPLPADPPAPSAPSRASWLRWLFRPEPLDPP